jgi:hypothetical protein
MFKQTLLVQWKWSRAALAALTVLVIIVPVLTMRIAMMTSTAQTPSSLVEFTEILGALLAIVSVICGIAVQNTAWQADISGRYVYALSLPITWTRFVWYRAAASTLLLVIPAVGLFLGGVVALSFVTLPETLHGYPAGVAVRFFLGSLFAFGLWGLLLRVTGQRASVVLLVLLLLCVVIPLVLQASGLGASGTNLLRGLVASPSPLAIYVARWALIDV